MRTANPFTQFRFDRGVVLVTLATFLTGFACLVKHGLWLDEGYSVLFASANGPDFIRNVSRVDGPIAPYYAILWLWFHILPVTLFDGRLLSLAFGTSCIPFMFLIGRRLFSPTVGLIAAGLLATDTLYWSELTSTRVYSLALFFCLVSFYACIESADVAVYSLINVLLFGLHIPFGLSIAALELGLLVAKKASRARVVAFLSINGVGFGSVVFLFTRLGATHSVWLPKLYPVWVFGNILGLSGPKIHDVPSFFIGHPAFFVMLPLLIAAWVFREKAKTTELATLVAWTLLPILLTLGISMFRPIFIVRYFLESLIPIVFLLAYGLSTLPGAIVKYSALSLLVLVQVYTTWKVDREPHEDWNAALDTLSTLVRRGDAVTFTWDDSEVAVIADRRLTGLTLPGVRVYPAVSDFTRLKEGLSHIPSDAPSKTIWVVSRTTWIPSPQSDLKAAIPPRYRQCGVRFLPDNIIDIVVFSTQCSTVARRS